MELRRVGLSGFAIAAVMSGCAGVGALVTPPAVTLTSVQMTDAAMDRQTFLLGFDVANPNPFPLPVRSVRYQIRLGEHHFASGEAAADFTVPAQGGGEFTLSVDLDLLRTTSYVSTLIRTGLRREMDYELTGSLIVDIPYARPLEFRASGNIELRASGF